MLEIGGDRYSVRPRLDTEMTDLSRWRQLENHGRWSAASGNGESPDIIGEWLSDSPSLFFDQRIDGDYIWQLRATRLRTDEAFHRRFARNKHAQGADPAAKYNFNFWLRVDAPDPAAEDFFESYPRKLGAGWNGMGDDHWNSLFTTVVWNPGDHWVRLRRSPGYVQVRESVDVVPYLPYDEPHQFTFAVCPRQGRVRMYFDDHRVYDYADAALPQAGYLGLCVWLCKVRFDAMRLFECLGPLPA